jgi:type IV secretion system protein TrbG
MKNGLLAGALTFAIGTAVTHGAAALEPPLDPPPVLLTAAPSAAAGQTAETGQAVTGQASTALPGPIVGDKAPIRPPRGERPHKPEKEKNPTPAAAPRDQSPAAVAVALSGKFDDNPKAQPAPGPDGSVVFTFGEAVPTIICAPLRICDLALEPGEVINDRPQIGDSVRWKLSPAVSGDKIKTVHIVIKPTEADLDTDLLVATNRRTYHLRLVSKPTDFVYAVAFAYPDGDAESFPAASATAAAKPEAPVVDELAGVAIDHLDFRYEVAADRDAKAFKPLRVFNDGTKTYLQMPDEIKAADQPALVIIGPDGNDQLVNYRFRRGYYVIDQLPEQIALIAGVGDDQARVVITHNACAKRNLLGFCES